MSKHAHFLIAVTVGVGIQPTAIAVVEQEVLKDDHYSGLNMHSRSQILAPRGIPVSAP